MSLIIHDGTNMPTFDPKDPRDRNWWGFVFSGLDAGETVTGVVFLIDDQDISAGETVSGITLHDTQTNGTDTVKAELSGGVVDSIIKLTARISTTVSASLDRSAYIPIAEL